MKNKAIILITVFTLIFANIYISVAAEKPQDVNILILYDKSSNNYWDIYHNYNQSLLTNVKVEPISLDNFHTMNLSEFQILYLDKSIIGKERFNSSKDNIIEYVKNGGYLFVEDSFYNEFPLDFLGAKEFHEIETFPKNLKYPDIRENLSGIQNTLKIFHKNLVKYYDDKSLNSLDKGHGFIPDTATTIASNGELSLYGLNQVDKGYVFYANSMLPNYNYITGFDLQKKDKNQEYFSFTFATGNYLFRNEFPAFVSKELYGYAAKKVLGPYGRPAMAWQNHFEVTSAIENGTMEKWIDLLKEYNEIPSFSLARAPYEWGEWYENIVIHENIGDNSNPKFLGDENSHYGGGKDLTSGGEYLKLNKYRDYKSLGSTLELPYRAYISTGDINGDGITDIISGSEDGNIYLFPNPGHPDKLKDENNNPINVGKYSAPILYDINQNGKLDIIVGNENGQVFLYINQGDLKFKKVKTLIGNKNLKNLSPTIGDIDGDNISDLIIGEAGGNLYFHKGKWEGKVLSFSPNPIKLNINVGKYPAPKFYDINGDGKDELIIGNSTGYLKIYNIADSKLIEKGYIEGENYNIHGNKRLWSGYYSVPEFCDLNGKGKSDLLVGNVRFSLPIPIGSEGFPQKEALKKSLAYAKENHIKIYPHIYFGKYKSKANELEELKLHQEAFEYYNIPWENIGGNQHTWDINNFNPTQSFESQIAAGIKWNSGFRPNKLAGEPSLSRDYIFQIPFKLSKNWETKDFILFTPSPHIPMMEGAYENIVALDLPISHFYHIEYGMNTEKGIEDLKYKAKFLDDIRNKNEYNFMQETDMFNTFNSILNSNVNIKSKGNEYHIESDNSIVGIKFEPGEELNGHKLSTNGDIYMRDGKNLYIGLNENIKVYISNEEDKAHIIRVNGEIAIEKAENQYQIHFKNPGLQQIKIYAPNGLEVLSGDFEIEKEGDYYTLTRYGEATTLALSF